MLIVNRYVYLLNYTYKKKSEVYNFIHIPITLYGFSYLCFFPCGYLYIYIFVCGLIYPCLTISVFIYIDNLKLHSGSYRTSVFEGKNKYISLIQYYFIH